MSDREMSEKEKDSPSPEIILASSSPYRQRLLQQIGLECRAIPPEIDESTIQNDPLLKPTHVAEILARLKAESVAKSHPDSIVIGSDQIVEFDGKPLGKPATRENNIHLLKQLNGKTHQLVTAVCLVHQGASYAFTNRTLVTMRTLTDAEIARYVDRDQAFDCAGGYRWEAAGITIFEKVDTEDHTAILGLPLIRLVTVLRSLGVVIP